MNELEIVLRGWPLLLGAFGLAITLIVGFTLVVDVGSKTRMELMGIYFIIVPLATIVGVVVSGRDLTKLANSISQLDIASIDTGSWVSRGVTLICLGVALERVARYFLQKNYLIAKGKAMVWAMVVYVMGVSVLPSIFGSVTSFNHQLIYALPVFIAVFAYAQTHTAQIIIATRNTIFVFLLLSLAFLAVNPTLVAETNYQAGMIPGATLRFYGFATHPNTLAPLCLILISCIRLKPYSQQSLNYLTWGTSGLAMILTQSKTSFLLMGLVLFYFWFFDSKQSLSARGSAYYQQWILKVITVVTLAASIVLAVVLFSSISGGSLGNKISAIFDNNQFDTLTGRTQIWAATFNVLADNPIFGYGPTLWSVDFRNKTGLQYSHAHNQYIQTLGSSGIVGLISLFAFLGTFGLFASRANSSTRGVSIGLIFFIVFRGITEVPLKIDNPFQSEFLTLMFLLSLSVGTFQYAAYKPASAIRQKFATHAPSPAR